MNKYIACYIIEARQLLYWKGSGSPSNQSAMGDHNKRQAVKARLWSRRRINKVYRRIFIEAGK